MTRTIVAEKLEDYTLFVAPGGMEYMADEVSVDMGEVGHEVWIDARHFDGVEYTTRHAMTFKAGTELEIYV